MRFLLAHPNAHGPVNATAPVPVTNEEFSRTLARVLRRPCLFRAPAFVLRLAMGEMADALLLTGQRVAPARAHELGFRFEVRDAGAGVAGDLPDAVGAHCVCLAGFRMVGRGHLAGPPAGSARGAHAWPYDAAAVNSASSALAAGAAIKSNSGCPSSARAAKVRAVALSPRAAAIAAA